MKIALLYDGKVGAEIKAFLEGQGDELISKTPAEYSEYDSNLGVNTCPKWLNEFKPDWLILAWWPKIVHSTVLSAARHTLNTHNSLLPWCRGKHPNFWSIVEGVPYGVSLHEVTPWIDAGAVYAQREIAYDWSDTGEALHRKSLEATVEIFKAEWPSIRNNPQRTASESKGTYHDSRELEPERTIDLDQPTTARRLLNIIRAGDAYGHTARFRDGVKTYSVRVSIEECNGHARAD